MRRPRRGTIGSAARPAARAAKLVHIQIAATPRACGRSAQSSFLEPSAPAAAAPPPLPGATVSTVNVMPRARRRSSSGAPIALAVVSTPPRAGRRAPSSASVTAHSDSILAVSL
eukprot:TRINITY_DN16250_c0_g1_i2.p3 TRINITY_DN16250_c0_g1~~TRINITY_DN16250_c0_g1_i2.p3  ORF type:complete len:114 (-),score=31.90 TRINITY_DN16250_c0_g1_i2:68-409(-)